MNILSKAFLCILLFFFVSFIFSQTSEHTEYIVIAKGSEWFYNDGGQLPDVHWTTKSSLTNYWKKGKAPLGYNMDNIATTISYGNDSLNKNLTSYFLKTIYLDDVQHFFAYVLNLRRDDGAIVYINGNEVWRSNMPIHQTINPQTKSIKTITNKDEGQYQTKVLFPNVFIEGLNIIAVELHQRSKTTTDAVFDLELVATNQVDYLKNALVHQASQNVRLNSQIATLEYKIEQDKQQTELNLLATKNDLLRATCYVISMILLIALGTLFWLYQQSQKSLKIHKAQLEKLNKKIAVSEEELINDSLKKIQTQQNVEVLKTVVSNITQKPTVTKQDIGKIMKLIEHNFNQDNEEWFTLQKHLNTTHSEFYDRLQKTFPSLTQTELRHCSLIKLKFSTKEIARYLHINPKSVQASRYRIKKKLKLNESTDLRKFITAF